MTLLNPFFGEFGGMYVPQILVPALLQLEKAFVDAQADRPDQLLATQFIERAVAAAAQIGPMLPVALDAVGGGADVVDEEDVDLAQSKAL